VAIAKAAGTTRVDTGVKPQIKDENRRLKFSFA
jgi:hypothetical protein